jgi:hypothetical protein
LDLLPARAVPSAGDEYRHGRAVLEQGEHLDAVVRDLDAVEGVRRRVLTVVAAVVVEQRVAPLAAELAGGRVRPVVQGERVRPAHREGRVEALDARPPRRPVTLEDQVRVRVDREDQARAVVLAGVVVAVRGVPVRDQQARLVREVLDAVCGRSANPKLYGPVLRYLSYDSYVRCEAM